MKVASLLTLVLVSTRAYEPSLIKYGDDSLAQEKRFRSGIDKLLSPLCGGEKECRVLVDLTADVCSTPSNGDICQSDCQFLLERVFERLLVGKSQLDGLRDFVPDCCVPGIRPASEEEDEKDEFEGENEFRSRFDKGEKYHIFHVGYENDWDEDVQEGFFGWKFVDERSNSSFCELNSGDGESENIILKAGDVLVEDCSQERAYLNGEIRRVCLKTGYLLTSANQCETNLESLSQHAENEAWKAMENIPDEGGFPEQRQPFDEASKFLKEMTRFLVNKEKGRIEEFYDYTGRIGVTMASLGNAVQDVAYHLSQMKETDYDAKVVAFRNFEDETNALRIEAEKYGHVFETRYMGQEVKDAAPRLSTLETNIVKYSENMSKATLDPVRISCLNFDPRMFLLLFVRDTLQTIPRDYAIDYEFDYKKYTASLAKPLLVYGVRSVAAAIKCSVLFPKRKSLYEEVYQSAMALESSVRVLYDHLKSVTDYIKDHAVREWFEKDILTYVEIHKGYDNFYAIEGLYPVLRDKYDFYDYALAAYDDLDNDNDRYDDVGATWNCYRCVGDRNSGFYTRRFPELGVKSYIVVMYATSPAPLVDYDRMTSLYEEYGQRRLQPFVTALARLNSKNRGDLSNVLAVRPGRNFACNNDTSKVGRFYDVRGVNVFYTN